LNVIESNKKLIATYENHKTVEFYLFNNLVYKI